MRRAVVAFGLLCALGCGGESKTDGGGDDDEEDGNGGVPSCGDFLACGGDVVGSWDIDETCIDSEMLNPISGCVGSSARYRSYDANGTFVFEASGIVTEVIDATFDSTWTIPRACLSDLPCPEIGDLLSMATGEGGNTIDFDARCPVAPTTCSCEVSGSVGGTVGGTYYITGATIALVQEDGTTGISYDYCVEGDSLTLRTPDAGILLTRL